ncbi:hypothetical protein GCM10022247_34620 [Allokutzneria multivorans]|uniref:Uncharacterized protein n=1 Tax=Allokutzneria multivorans TaxID=1142134 RepID=A0ABP7SBU5_9PSEU
MTWPKIGDVITDQIIDRADEGNEAAVDKATDRGGDIKVGRNGGGGKLRQMQCGSARSASDVLHGRGQGLRGCQSASPAGMGNQGDDTTALGFALDKHWLGDGAHQGPPATGSLSPNIDGTDAELTWSGVHPRPESAKQRGAATTHPAGDCDRTKRLHASSSTR